MIKNFLYNKKNNQLKWIHLVNPTPIEIKDIIYEYNIPSDYISDVSDPYELPRTEGLDDDDPNLFILNYPVKLEKMLYSTRAISIVILKDTIITAVNEASSSFENYLEELSGNFEKISDGVSILLEISWFISKTFIEYSKTLNNEIRDLEIRIKKSTKTSLLYDMIDIQKSLINFESATSENTPVIEDIFNLERFFNDKNKSLLKDLQIENRQARIMIEKSTNYLENLSDLYSNVINNNLNISMKVLTSVSIVMTVPTIISGFWGMNTRLPISDNPNAFYYLIILSLSLCFGIIYILRKHDYI
ncbi:MAG: magnesium transporter CorA family protein [Anaerococcus sp.]